MIGRAMRDLVKREGRAVAGGELGASLRGIKGLKEWADGCGGVWPADEWLWPGPTAW
jgi:hypothetical protein